MMNHHAQLTHPHTGLPLEPLGYSRRGPIWPILGASEDDDQGDTGDAGDQGDAGDAGDDDGTDALGDAGKQALDRMKEQRNAARAKAREFEALGMTPAEIKKILDGRKAADGETPPDPEALKAEGRREATAAANNRILRSEIKAAAAGKVAPEFISDLPVLLDLSALEVDDDGNVDEDEIADAIDALLKKKPLMAVPAQGEKRFQGSADGGTRKGSAKSIDDQIAEATAAHNIPLAISLKRQKAYAQTP